MKRPRLIYCVSGVEIPTRYRDLVRPQGLEVERIAPTAP